VAATAALFFLLAANIVEGQRRSKEAGQSCRRHVDCHRGLRCVERDGGGSGGSRICGCSAGSSLAEGKCTQSKTPSKKDNEVNKVKLYH